MKRYTALLVGGIFAFSFNSALSMEACLKCHKTAEKVAEYIKKTGVKSEAELVDFLKNKSSKKGIHKSIKDEEIKEAFAKTSGKPEKKETETKETEKKSQETKSGKKETTKKKTIQKKSTEAAPSKNENQTQGSPSKEVTPKQETSKTVTPSQDQSKSQTPSQEKPKKKVEGC